MLVESTINSLVQLMLKLCLYSVMNQIDGHGIDSLASFFLDFGYTQKEELSFPAKKLKAFWFSPPSISNAAYDGDGVNGPLPRVFISQLLVDQMSKQTQVRFIKFSICKNLNIFFHFEIWLQLVSWFCSKCIVSDVVVIMQEQDAFCVLSI